MFVLILMIAAAAVSIGFALQGDGLALPRDKYEQSQGNAGETAPVFALLESAGTEVATETPGRITLSHGGFFYSEDISVDIRFEADNVTEYSIHYTSDGAIPDKNAARYSQPLVIRADAVQVKGYCLKVRAYYIKEGVEYETPVLTHTYFVSKAVSKRFDTLVFAVSAHPDDLFSYDNGIFVEGKLRDDFVRNNPTKEIIPPDPANYNLRGLAGERPAYVEVFEPDGTRVLAQGIGLRVQGGWSRALSQKSLRLLAKSAYDPEGLQGKFHYLFFEGAASVTGFPAAAAFDKLDGLVLRNHANDFRFAFVRNELSATLAKRAGFPDVSPVRAAAVFVNGEYYGFSWLYIQLGLDYLKQNYQALDDHFAVINVYEGEWGCGTDLDDGPPDADKDFQSAYDLINEGMENDEVYEAFCTQVDIDNLTLYYAIQCYIDNRDWPGNNMKVWRYCGTSADNPNLDGRWRYMFYDNEFAWGLYGETAENDTLSRLLGLEKQDMGGASPLLTALLARADYREKFITTLCDVASGAFSYAAVSEALNALAAEQEHELTTAFKALKDYSSYAGLAESRVEIEQFAKQRVGWIYTYLKKHFKLSSIYRVTVTGAEGMVTCLNSQTANGAQTITSRYFAEHGVTLSAYAKSAAYTFSHWVVNGEVVAEKELLITDQMARAGEIEIELVATQKPFVPVMIREVYASGGSDWVKVYNNSSEAVSTEGLYLTDTLLNPQKWAFPAFTIEPYSDAWLVCDNNQDAGLLMQVKLPFNISEGEVLLLSDQDGVALSQVAVPAMNRNETLLYHFNDGLYHIKDKERE